jgi:hypothetical protein
VKNFHASCRCSSVATEEKKASLKGRVIVQKRKRKRANLFLQNIQLFFSLEFFFFAISFHICPQTAEELVGLRVVLNQGVQDVWVDDSGIFKMYALSLLLFS